MIVYQQTKLLHNYIVVGRLLLLNNAAETFVESKLNWVENLISTWGQSKADVKQNK